MKRLLALLMLFPVFAHAEFPLPKDGKWYIIGGVGSAYIEDQANNFYVDNFGEQTNLSLSGGVGMRFTDSLSVEAMVNDFGSVTSIFTESVVVCDPDPPVFATDCERVVTDTGPISKNLVLGTLEGKLDLPVSWTLKPYLKVGAYFGQGEGLLLGGGVSYNSVSLEYRWIPSVDTWDTVDIHSLELVFRFP